MSKGDHAADPRGLIREAYRMNVALRDCRTIFFDWALGLPEGDPAEHIRALFDHYGNAQPDHPMTAVLREGLEASSRPPRRRGHRSRKTTPSG